MIGECGYPVSESNVGVRSTRKVQIAKDFVEEACRRGYHDCHVWNQDFAGDANKTSINQWLKQFAGQNRQTTRPTPQTFMDRFRSLFGR